MFNGEKTTGIAIQRVNAGIDTGEFVKRCEIPIQNKTLRALRREMESLGIELYIQAIVEVKRGMAKFEPQVGRGRLYKNPKAVDIIKLWWKQLRAR